MPKLAFDVWRHKYATAAPDRWRTTSKEWLFVAEINKATHKTLSDSCFKEEDLKVNENEIYAFVDKANPPCCSLGSRYEECTSNVCSSAPVPLTKAWVGHDMGFRVHSVGGMYHLKSADKEHLPGTDKVKMWSPNFFNGDVKTEGPDQVKGTCNGVNASKVFKGVDFQQEGGIQYDCTTHPNLCICLSWLGTQQETEIFESGKESFVLVGNGDWIQWGIKKKRRRRRLLKGGGDS